ncbi:hypothetical protein [Microcoleus sp. D2_18a_D3]|uniref:hypothetical protein n=1 Tax=Microcoleus sp. D2_18a_D3 TaxID=3055330 RepID=UPI002FD4E7B8
MDRATLRQMAIATFSQVGIQFDEANVKAEIDDNWFLGGSEPTNQLYFVHLLVDGQGREEPGLNGWVEFNWKGEMLPLGAAGTG